MHKFIRPLAGSATLIGAVLLLQAQAQAQVPTRIDFEAPGLAGLYKPGETFSDAGYLMTPGVDFGVVGMAGDLGSVAPSGNATQFYFNSRDGGLLLTRGAGRSFSLDGFSIAFVPLHPAPVSAPEIVFIVDATKANGDKLALYFPFGSGTSGGNSHPFTTYDASHAFAGLVDLTQVDFYACTLTAAGPCQTATQNNGQFAIDDILVSAAVPEPASVALMALGLLGLCVGLRSRRGVRSD